MTTEERARLIDFDSSNVITPMIYPPRPRLVVNGTLPTPDMEASLVPLVYISQPPYWGIQVVGTMTGEPGPHVTPAIAVSYTVELDLEGVVGTTGIEVIGASRTEQHEVPTGSVQPVEEPA